MKIVTAASLFDGHDVAINLFRRLFVAAGVEVIHLGHNRSVGQIVKTAREEDVDAVCVSSYQGGHMEFYRYLREQLEPHVAIFGGGGGTILPSEIEQLHSVGITRLYHAEDGQKLGLRGIIRDAIGRMSHEKRTSDGLPAVITRIEEGESVAGGKKTHVIGVTGPGGAGKSSLVDELILRHLIAFPEKRVAVLAIDPQKRKTGGALLGDRIRMNSIYDDRVFVRSISTRSEPYVKLILEAMGEFDVIFLETTGIGQADSAVVDLVDETLYVMTKEYGASSQLEKIDMIDYANVIAINKFDHIGAEAALEDVQHLKGKDFPVFGTIASDFNDPGVTELFTHLFKPQTVIHLEHPATFTIVPQERTFYLSEIAKCVRDYHETTAKMAHDASNHYKVSTLEEEFGKKVLDLEPLSSEVEGLLHEYEELSEAYRAEQFSYQVRGKTITRELHSESLSETEIPKVATPRYDDWGERVRFMRKENFPGHFPFTAGVFPLKSEEEDPTRQFAGEGTPERTNKRFHYLSENNPVKRLSTAFDSVTLYGEDPDVRMDIYGKIGNSGVSIATLEDMRKLYDGFDLNDPTTSVSLTINGPAPIILAMFFNVALEQDPEALSKVRGTVQADILKEEQAQNTCIFSSKFALKMMGDMEEFFIERGVKNFYSVSVSGYHIAEAGANPISQLAFTLSNGFTLVEYYLARGMQIDDFARHLSFFFSMGMDPEYSVIGRVARRIWAISMREKYGANERSCKLKYHVQTSGRSLHAQEIDFNDIRTTLQALLGVYDNCNSLHTNAYDEAITTPTEESVRRAIAIQKIISEEYGTAKCENPMQGSYFFEELTDLVEEAVLNEFERLSRRGGVLGAMEKQYQRHQIQTESMKYEQLKSTGELPIIGVNTFTSPAGQPDYENIEVIRATDVEKKQQIENTKTFIDNPNNQKALDQLATVALSGGNIFGELMHTVKHCSLGQITHTLYQCGGEYRRSM